MILLVEANPVTRKLMRVALEMDGHDVVEVADGHSAMAAFDDCRPDLVIVDYVLPDTDGLKLIGSLRQRARAATLPALVVTGMVSRLEELSAQAGPRTQFLSKPVEPSRLVDLARASLAPPNCRGRNRRILIVDDEPLSLKLAVLGLVQAGFEVETATGGVDALAHGRLRPPDAILSDVMMSGMDGFEFCMEARKDPQLASLPIVLVSAVYLEEADQQLARDVGASALVTRGVDMIEAVEALESSLDKGATLPTRADPAAVGRLHHERVRAQLERQMARNEMLIRQTAIQATALSVVRGLSEILTRPRDASNVIGDVLVHCLDASGLSTGLLYLAGPGAEPHAHAQFGVPAEAKLDAESGFGQAAFLKGLVEAGRPIAYSTRRGAPDAGAQEFLARLGQPSILFVPFAVLGQGSGILVLASDTHDLSETAWLSFARSIAAQFGQTVALGHSLNLLAASESRHRAMMEQANDAILIIDRAGSICEANREAERLFGRLRSELVSASLDRFLLPEGGQLTARVQAGPNLGHSLPVESRMLLRPDGARVTVEVSISVVRVDQDSDDCVLLANIRDTTERRKSDEALRESEERMRLVLESAAEAICGIDRHGNITFANPACARLLGLPSPASLLGKNLHRLAHHHLRNGEPSPPEACPFNRTVATGAPAHVTDDVLWRADDTSFPAEYWAHPMLHAGEIVGAVVTFFDSTERVQTQMALEEAQLRLLHVISSSPAVLYSLRPEGTQFTATWVSKNIEWLLGYTPEEAMPPDWWPSHLHPADRQRVFSELEGLSSAGELTQEYRFQTKHGEYRWLSSELRLLRDAAGVPVEVIGSWSDVTARKEAELRQAESEEEYRLLFDNNPHPMWVFDLRSLEFLAVNDAAVRHYGYSRAEFFRMKVSDLPVPEEVEGLIESIRRASADGRSESHVRHRKKDGTVIRAEIARSPIVFLGREARLVLSMDVTEKLDLQAQLFQAQKLESVGRLAGGVAHDFNNLLGVITGYSELLKQRLSRDEHVQVQLDAILLAADRATELTRQLLAFSRKQVLQPRVLNLNNVVAEVERMMQSLIGGDIVLSTRLDPHISPVRADEGQLEQVLMNLVVNARDAMPQGGKLTIETGIAEFDQAYAAHHPGVQAGRYALLAVSDTGEGMSPDVRGQIFEPFFTTKALGKGSGLGLATVHGIVRQSGGHIFVYSEPGKGSTFKVYLPIADEPESPAVRSEDQNSPRGLETVLVVEDESALREIVRAILEGHGYTILHAPSAEAALEISASYSGTIQLMITDVVMPGLGGSELAKQMVGQRPEMKVIYMSGYTDDAAIVHEVLNRDAPFLEKPFTAAVLCRKVREVLDRR